jgi:FKBP-type peptidyl-prolyl cis-trans isomerase FkpA
MRRVLALLLLTAFAAACTDAPASPSPSVPFTQTDLRIGTGAEAVNGSVLTMNYTGWLYDASKADRKGLQFDSSIGQPPFVFTLGVGQVIRGWDQGVPGLKVGGLRQLIVPPSLAYGDVRSGGIPPNSTLVFDVELVGIQ